MEEDRTASSSRRSAKWRERSRGSESRVWVYSERRARVYGVVGEVGIGMLCGLRDMIGVVWRR